MSALTHLLIEKPLKRVRLTSFTTLVCAVIGSIVLLASLSAILPSAAFVATPKWIPTADLGVGLSEPPVDDGSGHSELELGPARFVGDSFLGEWAPILQRLLDPLDITIEPSHPWMKIIPDFSGGNYDGSPNSAPLWDAINRQPPPKSLILFSYSYLFNGRSRRIEEGSPFVSKGTPEWAALVKEGAKDALKDVSPATKIVIVLSHRVTYGRNFENCIQNGDPSCKVEATEGGFDESRQVLIDFANENGITVVSLDNFVCPNKICENIVNGTSQFGDVYHISHQFAEMVAPQFVELLGSYF